MNVTVTHDSKRCPACGAGYEEQDYGYIEIAEDMDGNEYAWQKVRCESCGQKYSNVYGYSHTEFWE